MSLLVSLSLSLYATDLCIFYLVLPCLALTSLCYYMHDVVWARLILTLPYHIISYLMFVYFISSADLISIVFYSILFYSTLFQIDLIWFDSILFYWIRFTILFSIVSHINEWFVSICPSICPSVCVSVCLFVYLYE